jgi:hypothetical protein
MIVIAFTTDVVSGSATVSSGIGSVLGPPTFSGTTMTVHLTGVADVQQITVTLSNVSDSSGQVLPPIAVSMKMLIGDVNADRVVNSGDALQTRSRAGQGTDNANFRWDLNADGVINSGDTLVVRSRSGNSVP